MLQKVQDKILYVVDFDTMPELPITGLTEGERVYMTLTGDLPGHRDVTLVGLTSRITYAQALTDAIETGVITEPGKYGIDLDRVNCKYEIYKITE